MDVATVSVLSSAVVGLGGLAVAVVTARMSEKRHIRETRDARVDELRSVVDSAAVALMSVRNKEPSMRDGFDRVREALPDLREAVLEVRAQEARLATRLGLESPIVHTYQKAHEAVAGIHEYYAAVVEGETPAQELSEANAAVPTAVSAFFSVAATVVGPDRQELSSSPSRRRRGRDSQPAG
jgi:hypothetical protein